MQRCQCLLRFELSLYTPTSEGPLTAFTRPSKMALAAILVIDAYAAIAVIGRSYASMSIHINLRAGPASCQHQAMVRACFNDTTASDRAVVLLLERILPPVITLARLATAQRIYAPRRRQPRPSPATIRLYSTACSSTITISFP